MAEDKELERQYRKNLMVVASIILIYSISGGHIASDLSMFGAKLTFSRPVLLEYAGILMMCFLWWRHWQVSGVIRMHLGKNILRNMPITWLTKIHDHPLLDYAPSKYEDVGNGLGMRKTGIRFEIVRQQWDEKKAEMVWRQVDTSGFSAAKLLAGWFWSGINQAIKNPQFGDAILPTLITIIAGATYAGRILNIW